MSEVARTFTCVVCPNGCEIEAIVDESRLVSSRGHRCPRGRAWIEREITSPERSVTTSVAVRGGDLPLASVRTSSPVPLSLVADIMSELKKITVDAPVVIGDVIAHHPAGSSVDVIATRSVAAR